MTEGLGSRREGPCIALVNRAIAISDPIFNSSDPTLLHARAVNFLRQTISGELALFIRLERLTLMPASPSSGRPFSSSSPRNRRQSPPAPY